MSTSASISKRQVPEGTLFLRDKCKHYLSYNKHRPLSSSKSSINGYPPSRWKLSRDDEYGVFLNADNYNWNDPDGHYWGILMYFAILGTRGEKIAFFRKPINSADPWHGYPISPVMNKDDAPPHESVIYIWETMNIIDAFDAQRIADRKV